MFGATIGLTGTTDLVEFNGTDFVLTLGESCPSNVCSYGGSQTLGAGTLAWAFASPDNGSIQYDGVGDISGPSPAGTFNAGDGVDSLTGSFVFNSWEYDGVADGNGDDGIDLFGTITVTGTTLVGGGDPNQAAFESMFDLPGATAYGFTLDVGDCTNGDPVPCIPVPDPSASFISLNLTQQSTAPEPGTFVMAGLALASALATYRRQRNRAN
jgi:hypothetical protein